MGHKNILYKKYFRSYEEALILLLAFLYVFFVVIFPIAKLFTQTINLANGDILSVIDGLYNDSTVRKAFLNTLYSSILSVFVSLFIGILMAFVTVLTDVRYKTTLVFMMFIPMLIPAQITAVSWLELMGHINNISKMIGISLNFHNNLNPLYSKEGIVFLMGIEHSPLVFLTLKAGLKQVPQELIDVAKTSGADNFKIISKVISPLMLTYLIVGSSLAFIASIGNFGIPALLGIPGKYLVLTTLIYQRLSSFGPTVLGEVGGLSFILITLAIIAMMIQFLGVKLLKVKIKNGKNLQPLIKLGSKKKYLEIFAWLILFSISFLPLLAMITTSLLPTIGVELSFSSITFDNYIFAFEYDPSKRAFVNSMFLSIEAAAIIAFIGVLFSYLVIMRENKLASYLNIFIDAPFAMPGLVLSIACIMAFIKPIGIINFSIYNTAWIILVAYMARFLSFGLRPIFTTFSQVDKSLEEAAQISGAKMFYRLKSVILPMVLPSVVAGAILVFMGAFNELTVSSLLWSVGNETLGVIIYNLYDEGNATGAAAISTLTVIITFALAFAISLFSRNLPKGVLPWQE